MDRAFPGDRQPDFLRPAADPGTFLAVLVALLLVPSDGRAQPRPGGVAGIVLEAATGLPLPGATILVEPGGRGDAAGADGRFSIHGLAPGRYVLTIRFLGFQAVVRPDIEVTPGRVTTIEVALRAQVYESEEVVVRAGWFAGQVTEPSGVSAFGTEEIRRAAGAAGDVQRLLAGLPSVARMDDMHSGLAVRGGSPFETRFLVDGIPVANLNHFPTQGSSGGALGIVAADLIGEVTFRPGAFPARHHDRMGAVVDLDLRPSADRPLAFRGDFSIAGMGLFAEGTGHGAEWLVGLRRSWVDLLVRSFLAEQADAIPTYSDVVARLAWTPSRNHRLSFVDLGAFDRSGIDRDAARDHHENLFGTADFDANTAGARWRAVWSPRAVSSTTLSHGWSGRRVDFRRTATNDPFLEDRADENVVRLAHETRLALSPGFSLDAGADLEWSAARFRTRLEGQTTLAPEVNRTRSGVFVSASWQAGRAVRLDPGMRIDRYDSGTIVQPRASIRFTLFPSAWLRLSAGRYAQALPAALVAQDAAYEDLRVPESRHVVAGFAWQPREAMQVTVDAYVKRYFSLPEDATRPLVFAIDRLYDDALPLPLWPEMGGLSATGRARSRGIEFTLQQRLARSIYGLVSLGLHRSSYLDGQGSWRPRLFDNRVVATIDGGWRPDDRQQLGLRFSAAGGRPYTPFDVAASRVAGTGVADAARVQGARLPDYHALTLRYDRRFPVRSAWIVAYAEVWNVYGRRNLSGTYWDETEARVRERLQWGTLPVVGFEVLFR